MQLLAVMLDPVACCDARNVRAVIQHPAGGLYRVHVFLISIVDRKRHFAVPECLFGVYVVAKTFCVDDIYHIFVAEFGFDVISQRRKHLVVEVEFGVYDRDDLALARQLCIFEKCVKTALRVCNIKLRYHCHA